MPVQSSGYRSIDRYIKIPFSELEKEGYKYRPHLKKSLKSAIFLMNKQLKVQKYDIIRLRSLT